MHRILGIVAFVPIALAVVAARSAEAAWPHTAYLGNVPACTSPGNQIYPRTCTDGAGGMILTWTDQNTNDVFAQRVSAAGVPLWTANGVVVCNAVGAQANADIASDGAGGAIIIWTDTRGGANTDLYAQRLNAAGLPQWTANGVVICNAANDQNLYYTGGNIVADGAGGAFMAWNDARSGTSFDIYAQRINAAGVVQWAANGVAVCVQPNAQNTNSVATDGVGGFLVSWWDQRGANLDVYAQRLNSGGVPQWTINGTLICNAAGDQDFNFIVGDGMGGAVVAWRDWRGGSADLYAQRLSPTGGPSWAVNGTAVCLAAGEQDPTGIVPDGAGGYIVTWWDARSPGYDIYAQRIVGGAAQWATDGVPICTASGNQVSPVAVSDGVGGVIVAWIDGRAADYDIYVQRVNQNGYPQWNYNGVPVCTSPGEQAYSWGHLAITSDGNGGALIAWADWRAGALGSVGDIYAQRIERFGWLGSPEPSIASVRDVPFDQGGHIKVTWNASYLDADPFYIGSYSIWRSVPPNAAASALASGARLAGDGEAVEARPGQRTFKIDAVTGYAWEYVGNQTARGFASYSFVVPTLGDSVGAGNPRTAVMVEAQGGSGWWDSAPDSGYSVDNLPPSQPTPFQGGYFAGATHLHWNPNVDVDLAGYRLYKGSSSGFVPGPGNLVSAQSDTGYADNGAAGSWYKLSAVDAHGNESPFAILGPNGTVAVDGHTPATLAFALASSNPSHSGARFRLSLPRATDVRLAVYDVAGREMMVLMRGAREAGVHELAWDGRDAAGRPAPDGMYVARLVAGGEVRAARFMMLR